MRALFARLAWLAIAAITLTGIAETVHAGSLRIMPIRVEAPPDARFCSLTIANDEDEPVSVQVRGYGWSKDTNGIDVLTEDTGFQVNPTILTLGAKEQRLVRCSLPPRYGQAEQTWRLLIDELPRPGPSPGGIRTLLRISLPVFRAPAGAAPDLVWSMGETTTGGVERPALVIENRGSRHTQVLSLELMFAQSGKGDTIAGSFYILAGGRAAVVLPDALAGAPITVRASTPDGPLDLRSGAGS